ncbi:MAG TPA: hypothetical protein VGE12_22875 [Noviherbaspirillum sp.]
MKKHATPASGMAAPRHSATSLNTTAQSLPTYNPNHLLDTLMLHFGISSDGALARRLNVARALIGKIRAGTVPVCASMLLWMQETTGIDVAELRRLMGDRRARYRLGISLQPRPAAA